jgi:glycosyltransferase involved in cell wall biosynthesis
MQPAPLRVVVLSRVFPSTQQPTYGVFVKERVRRVAARCPLTVVAPVPWFPFNRLLRGVERTPDTTVDMLDGMVVHRPRVLSPPRWGKCLDGFLYAGGLLPFFARLRRRIPFDLIDAHFAYPDGVAAVLLGKALGCPVVITVRGDEARLVRFALRRPQLRFALRSARVIAVSDFLRRLVADLGVPTDRVRVIPNGVDVSRFHPSARAVARAQLGLPQDRTILLAVGSLTELKGHHRVLEILPELLSRRSELLYVIVGNDAGGESWRAKIENQVRAQGLAANVRLAIARPHEEIPSWMAAADLFCLATQREGCCNAIIEALACGLPVVTTRVGGNPELVREGEDGLLVPFWDAAAFSAAVLAALERQWDRPAIAARASRLGWDDVATALLEEYREAVGAQ